MLTDQQLINLKSLCDHPRYGFIVQKAIEIWSGEINPIKNKWGIDTWNGIWKSDSSCCCLVATNLINKQEIVTDYLDKSMSLEASKHLNLGPWEIFAMIEGFDGDSKDPEMEINENFVNAYEFGKSVSKAIWG